MADAIVLLAGGAARRFPGKLEHSIGGRPMIVRLLRNLQHERCPVYVAGKGSFSPDVDALIEAPLLIDRHPPSGPLRALVSACSAISADRIFALAADQPSLDGCMLDRLRASWQSGDEAVVPHHSGGIEPLAALYDRAAVLREGLALRRRGRNAMHDLIGALATRYVSIEARFFYNVNSPDDLCGETSSP